MGPLLILLIAILSVIAVIFFILCYLYFKFKRVMGVTNLSSFINDVKNYDRNNYSTEKSISGMTRILEPLIIKDFPDFNLKHLYSNIETGITNVLSAKSKLDTKFLNKGLDLIKGKIIKEINDMREDKIEVNYSDLRFNQHALKSYKKNNGTATITTTSSVSYKYSSNKKERKYDDLRCESKFECEFIYIYDEDHFEEKAKSFSVHCPNCGAPVKGLGDLSCSYCGSNVKKVNLRNWEIASIKEIK
jgi:hypothetical protein